MKKLIKILTVISVLGSTVLSSHLTKTLVSDVYSFINKGFKSKNLFPFINKVNGISEAENIQNIVVSQNSDVYTWSKENLFKSTDGENFKKIFLNKITSVAVKGHHIYVGTCQDLFKSDDGINFTEASSIFLRTEILKVVVSPNGTIYIATNEGLYQSVDGINFTKISNLIITDLAITDTGIIYIIHENQLDKSIDGKEWVNILSDTKNNFSSITLSAKDEICLVTNSPTNNYLYISNNSVNFIKISPSLGIIHKALFTLTGVVILATDKGLYQNLDGINFTLFMPLFNKSISAFTLDLNKRAFIAIPSEGLYEIDLLNNLLTINKPDYDSTQYDDTLVYNTWQNINLKSIYLTNAVLNGQTLVLPDNNVKLTKGKYILNLTLKTEYKKFISIFGGDYNKGIITYNFEIKDNINNKIVSYSPSADNTILEKGLVSNAGNTNGCEIIQTKAKPDSGDHQAQLNIDINNKKVDLIDYKKSYYISGEVDGTTNDFHNTGNKQLVKKHFTILNDAIYQFHLVDLVGNVYNSYLELGKENNNKLHGNITDSEVVALATKLNVTVSVFNPNEKADIMAWLQNYQIAADQAFNKSLRHSGKGFDIKVSDLPNGYKDFLDPITYLNSQTSHFINTENLRTIIYNFANNELKNSLIELKSEKFNIDSRNIVDKKTLDKFTIWMNNYQNYVYDNENIWFNKISRIATRGFGAELQIERIKRNLNDIQIFSENYLNKITWNSNFSNTNFNYSKLIKLDIIQNQEIAYTNKIFPELNKLYQDYLNNVENQVYMYGYSLRQLLGNNPLPQTKDEIDNYLNNKSFSLWLQQKAITKFHKWQLIIGLSIGIPLFLIVALPLLYFYWIYNEKYNPREYKMYKRLQKIDQQRFKQKKNKKKKPFLE